MPPRRRTQGASQRKKGITKKQKVIVAAAIISAYRSKIKNLKKCLPSGITKKEVDECMATFRGGCGDEKVKENTEAKIDDFFSFCSDLFEQPVQSTNETEARLKNLFIVLFDFDNNNKIILFVRLLSFLKNESFLFEFIMGEWDHSIDEIKSVLQYHIAQFSPASFENINIRSHLHHFPLLCSALFYQKNIAGISYFIEQALFNANKKYPCIGSDGRTREFALLGMLIDFGNPSLLGKFVDKNNLEKTSHLGKTKVSDFPIMQAMINTVRAPTTEREERIQCINLLIKHYEEQEDYGTLEVALLLLLDQRGTVQGDASFKGAFDLYHQYIERLLDVKQININRSFDPARLPTYGDDKPRATNFFSAGFEVSLNEKNVTESDKALIHRMASKGFEVKDHYSKRGPGKINLISMMLKNVFSKEVPPDSLLSYKPSGDIIDRFDRVQGTLNGYETYFSYKGIDLFVIKRLVDLLEPFLSDQKKTSFSCMLSVLFDATKTTGTFRELSDLIAGMFALLAQKVEMNFDIVAVIYLFDSSAFNEFSARGHAITAKKEVDKERSEMAGRIAEEKNKMQRSYLRDCIIQKREATKNICEERKKMTAALAERDDLGILDIEGLNDILKSEEERFSVVQRKISLLHQIEECLATARAVYQANAIVHVLPRWIQSMQLRAVNDLDQFSAETLEEELKQLAEWIEQQENRKNSPKKEKLSPSKREQMLNGSVGFHSRTPIRKEIATEHWIQRPLGEYYWFAEPGQSYFDGLKLDDLIEKKFKAVFSKPKICSAQRITDGIEKLENVRVMIGNEVFNNDTVWEVKIADSPARIVLVKNSSNIFIPVAFLSNGLHGGQSNITHVNGLWPDYIEEITQDRHNSSDNQTPSQSVERRLSF